jgi:hypothetical protein
MRDRRINNLPIFLARVAEVGLVKPDNVYYVRLGVLEADWAGCAYEEEGIGFGE